ncbi:MAG TPA: helix-turn-helix domain-containing protein [Streptosporangiaceae bacterium]|jgi:DNA-binding HxlR family transcriptional regulator|nr:helix-turn-helix domain-containing protein [Streptosporangiaceae bacterium]
MERPWPLDYDPANCSIGAAVAIIGEKWTFLVLREVFNGIRRFGDMQRRTQAPRQILSDRLSRLVREGLLRRVPYQEQGQRSRHEYRLTEKGLDLYPIIVALMEWGDRYAAPVGPPVALTHRDCGQPVRLQLTCAHGHSLASAREVTPVPGPGSRKIV